MRIWPLPGNQADPRQLLSPRLLRLFHLYLRFYFWRHFHGVRISRDGEPKVPPGSQIVLYANHPSWWDPILILLVGPQLFPGYKHYGPMDQAALARYGVLRRLGVFGIDPQGPRGAARFLRTARNLLASGQTALWITAEGGFADIRARPVHLRAGIAHLARSPGLSNLVLLPVAFEYGFWNESRPEALLHFGKMHRADPTRTTEDWTRLLEQELTRTMDALAANSMTRDPGRFVQLHAGRAGVGGIYDLYRRARAWAAGMRFDSSHGGTG